MDSNIFLLAGIFAYFVNSTLTIFGKDIASPVGTLNELAVAFQFRKKHLPKSNELEISGYVALLC